MWEFPEATGAGRVREHAAAAASASLSWGEAAPMTQSESCWEEREKFPWSGASRAALPASPLSRNPPLGWLAGEAAVPYGSCSAGPWPGLSSHQGKEGHGALGPQSSGISLGVGEGLRVVAGRCGGKGFGGEEWWRSKQQPPKL